MPTFPALTQQKRTKNSFNPESQDNATLHSSKKQPYYQFWQLNWYYPSLVPDSDLSSDFPSLVAYSNLSSDFPSLVAYSNLSSDFPSLVPNSHISWEFACLV